MRIREIIKGKHALLYRAKVDSILHNDKLNYMTIILFWLLLFVKYFQEINV